jgi:hypothetical protein
MTLPYVLSFYFAENILDYMEPEELLLEQMLLEQMFK